MNLCETDYQPYRYSLVVEVHSDSAEGKHPITYLVRPSVPLQGCP